MLSYYITQNAGSYFNNLKCIYYVYNTTSYEEHEEHFCHCHDILSSGPQIQLTSRCRESTQKSYRSVNDVVLRTHIAPLSDRKKCQRWQWQCRIAVIPCGSNESQRLSSILKRHNLTHLSFLRHVLINWDKSFSYVWYNPSTDNNNYIWDIRTHVTSPNDPYLSVLHILSTNLIPRQWTNRLRKYTYSQGSMKLRRSPSWFTHVMWMDE